MKKYLKSILKVCSCGNSFYTVHPVVTLCPRCQDDIEHDANVEMFGEDAEYLEFAGLADKIGNK